MAKNKFLKTILLWLTWFLSTSSFLLSVQAAQIVRELPTVLNSNWTVCLHQENNTPLCSQQTLPQPLKMLPNDVNWVSYQKQLIIHQTLQDQLIAFTVANIDEADEVWFNDKKIGATGKLPPAFETGFRQPRTYLIPGDKIRYDQYNKLEIRAFSSRHLPPIHYQAPILGDFYQFQHQIQEQDYLYLAIIIGFLLLCIFQIFYLSLVRPNNEIIFLLIFYISTAGVTFLRSQMPLHLGLDTNLNLKLESFMSASSAIGLVMFLYQFFELSIRRLEKILLFLVGIAGVANLIWYDPMLSRQSMEVSQLVVLSGCLWMYIRVIQGAYYKQRAYVSLLAISLSVYWLLMLADLLMQSGWSGLSAFVLAPWLQPFAGILLSILLALTLTHKYWQFFKGATYDHLTGTMLRPAFFQRLSEEMQRSDRFKENLLVAVIDIHQVRKLTANYGQSTANQILSVVSNALTKVLRPFDLLCRFNDDEFCVAATVGSIDDARSCLDRIHKELTSLQHKVDKETEILLDAKMGGVIYQPEHHLSVSQILQDANYALAKCKNEANLPYYFLEKSQRNI